MPSCFMRSRSSTSISSPNRAAISCALREHRGRHQVGGLVAEVAREVLDSARITPRSKRCVESADFARRHQ